MSRRANPPWRRGPRNKDERRFLRRPRAAREARDRKAGLAWQQARDAFRESALPAGCIRIADALAERHVEVKSPDGPVYQGFGNRGDRRRVEAAARVPAADRNPLPALAEACRMSRRRVIQCLKLMVASGIKGFRKVPGGKHPDGDPRNVHPGVTHPDWTSGWRTRAACTRAQSMGGAGWANGYLVDGISDPEPPEPPEPEPPEAGPPMTSEQLAARREQTRRHFEERDGRSRSARGP